MTTKWRLVTQLLGLPPFAVVKGSVHPPYESQPPKPPQGLDSRVWGSALDPLGPAAPDRHHKARPLRGLIPVGVKADPSLWRNAWTRLGRERRHGQVETYGNWYQRLCPIAPGIEPGKPFRPSAVAGWLIDAPRKARETHGSDGGLSFQS